MLNFSNIWFTEKRYGFFQIRNPKKGTLTFEADKILFRADKFELDLQTIKSVEYVKMLGDIRANWIVILYQAEGETKRAYFSDASKRGWGNLVGGSQAIFQAFQNFYQSQNDFVDIVILTPIEVEFKALAQFLENQQTRLMKNGRNFLYGEIQAQKTKRIALIQSESGITETASASKDAIDFFQPKILMLAGIAMGVKDVKIGDIVVGTMGFNYEKGKQRETGTSFRPDIINYSAQLISKLRNFVPTGIWRNYLAPSRLPIYEKEKVKVVYGRIASGNKVIAVEKSNFQHFTTTIFDDTIALEMEAIGLLEPQKWHPEIQFMNIRGISDLGKGKNAMDKLGGQEIAAQNVAGFVAAFIAQE